MGLAVNMHAKIGEFLIKFHLHELHTSLCGVKNYKGSASFGFTTLIGWGDPDCSFQAHDLCIKQIWAMLIIRFVGIGVHGKDALDDPRLLSLPSEMEQDWERRSGKSVRAFFGENPSTTMREPLEERLKQRIAKKSSKMLKR
ncbi:hypothetical protein VNO77_19009 [Canavalia gladiata]|uniref:Uncharacterized protein n=1 Tax=Canavalia gladiata TaxID=3824 RepID=A0AAN9QK51_CANGL